MPCASMDPAAGTSTALGTGAPPWFDMHEHEGNSRRKMRKANCVVCWCAPVDHPGEVLTGSGFLRPVSVSKLSPKTLKT